MRHKAGQDSHNPVADVAIKRVIGTIKEQELLELRTDDIEDYLSVSQQLALEDEQVIRDAETDVANYFQDQVGGAFQAADHVHVERVAGSFSRTFQLFFNRYKVTVNELEDMQPGDTIPTIDLILEHILDEVLRDVGESDRVRLRSVTWTRPTDLHIHHSEKSADRLSMDGRRRTCPQLA